MSQINIKPFLKWVGGKNQIMEHLMERFPEEIDNYYEPFLGGGSVLIAVLDSKIKIKNKIFASDLNPNLINVYQWVKKNPSKLIKEVEKIISIYSKLEATPLKQTPANKKPQTIKEAKSCRESYYYWIRYKYNKIIKENSSQQAAMFIFLNKTCFRGMYRVGPNGFNVPYGHYKNPSIIDSKLIMLLSEKFQKVEFKIATFSEALKTLESTKDFVYMDPPYAPVNDTSFVSYTKNGFSIEKNKQLFELSKNLKCKFLLSNAKVPLITNSFASTDFQIVTISCRRSINAKKPGSKAEEVLIYPKNNLFRFASN